MPIIRENQYLEEVMPQIESNTNLAKKFPGIGATHLEIKSKRNSLLIEPNVPVIQGKCEKHKEEFNLFGVYEGVSVNKIIQYLKEPHEFHKVMTTPESFHKVKLAAQQIGMDIYSYFFCVIDESHLLVKDVDYREDIILPINDFFKFKQKALISATPIEFSDPRFIEQGFRTVCVDADFDYRKKITTVHTNNTFQEIDSYLKEHNAPICFFANLVDYNYSLIKQLKKEDESAIFCAPKSKLKLKNELNFANAYSEWKASRMKKYNFFTGRFFNAFDLELDYKPHVIMITDLKASAYTMLDINTDCVQIAGRFRNGSDSLTHIYTTDKNLPTPSKDEIRTSLGAHEHAYKTIHTFYDSASSKMEQKAFGEAMRSLPYNKLLNPDGNKNYFAIDNYINEKLVTASYNDSNKIEDLYYSNNMFIPSCRGLIYPYEIEHLKLVSSKITTKEKRIKIVSILSEIVEPLTEYDMDFINEIRKIDPILVEAYEELGIEAIREANYSEKKMKEALILNQMKCNSTVQLIKNSFRIGYKYKCSKIVAELNRIFEILKIHPNKPIRGETIKHYFDADPCKIGKKRERGYLLNAPLL